MLSRPRTWLIIGMLVALSTLVAVLLAITDLGPRPGTGPPFLSAVLSDGTLFPLAALGVVLPPLLPIAVAVLGGDAIAGESQTGRCATFSSGRLGVLTCCLPSSSPSWHSCCLPCLLSPRSVTPKAACC
jgi:hypothetical protein